MMRPDYVLFDCDGVLVDSERLTNQVFRDDFAAHGLDLTLEQVMDLFVGGTIESDLEKARAMGAELPDDWVTRIREKTHAVLAERCEPVPGVIAVLDQLDEAGIGYAVGSNGPMAKMRVTLGRCGLWDRFEGALFTADDCPAPKPAPDVYQKAAAQAGMRPDQCAVIEDSASGAQAAKAAGMRCCGYVADTPREKLAPHCDQVFDDMRDLPRILGMSPR